MSGQDAAAWLRAQIEARRELALLATSNRDPRGSGKRLSGEWQTGCTCKEECWGYPACEEVTGDGIHIYAEGGHDADQALLIAANDPQDTIARCEAELAILDELAAAKARQESEARDYASWVAGENLAPRPAFTGPSPVLIAGLEVAVGLLASGYRHRPGYAEAWKP